MNNPNSTNVNIPAFWEVLPTPSAATTGFPDYCWRCSNIMKGIFIYHIDGFCCLEEENKNYKYCPHCGKEL